MDRLIEVARQAPLLATKLAVPVARAALITRPPLIARLGEGLGRKLTLISAPAGFGKTTLLSSWLSKIENVKLGIENDHVPLPVSQFSILHSQFQVVWVSLDAGDNEPGRFWAYVITALERLRPGVGADALALLQAPRAAPIEQVLTALLNTIAALPDHVALVLDDYHTIDAQPMHDALTFLLDHLPPQLHLIIASRADPPLPLARMRGRGELAELRAADLRFTLAETEELLNAAMGLGLTPADVAALADRTEGWVTGLQLAALALRGQPDPPSVIASLRGSHRYILDYLVEEVLEQQPAQIQRFLLHTAILDRLNGSLCDAVAGIEHAELRIENDHAPFPVSQFSIFNSQFILEYLDQANLFIVALDHERGWYRYHQLFAEVLGARLQQTQPDLIPELHRRAAAWHERCGFAAESMEHALAAQHSLPMPAGALGADERPARSEPPSTDSPAPTLAEPLSGREREVLRLIATGMSNREIAQALVIAVGTVKTHMLNIYSKLGVHSRTQALARARTLSLV